MVVLLLLRALLCDLLPAPASCASGCRSCWPLDGQASCCCCVGSLLRRRPVPSAAAACARSRPTDSRLKDMCVWPDSNRRCWEAKLHIMPASIVCLLQGRRLLSVCRVLLLHTGWVPGWVPRGRHSWKNHRRLFGAANDPVAAVQCYSCNCKVKTHISFINTDSTASLTSKSLCPRHCRHRFCSLCRSTDSAAPPPIYCFHGRGGVPHQSVWGTEGRGATSLV